MKRKALGVVYPEANKVARRISRHLRRYDIYVRPTEVKAALKRVVDSSSADLPSLKQRWGRDYNERRAVVTSLFGEDVAEGMSPIKPV